MKAYVTAAFAALAFAGAESGRRGDGFRAIRSGAPEARSADARRARRRCGRRRMAIVKFVNFVGFTKGTAVATRGRSVARVRALSRLACCR